MRLFLMFVCSFAVVSCNFSDDAVHPCNFATCDDDYSSLTNNNPPNNENNNNPPNSSNNDADMGGDDGGGGGGDDLVVEFADVTVNSEPLPTQVSATIEFTVAAEVTISGATGAVQVVVAVDGGGMGCLVDETPTTVAISASTSLEGPLTTGTRELMWGAYEEADCDAALALAMETPPTGRLGEIEFTVPPALTVIQISPDADETDVVVGTTVRVTFDVPIDAASLTGRVRLSSADGQVPATVSVAGTEVILTPSSALDEFQTRYTVLVVAGITGSGRSLETDFSTSFTTLMFVPDEFYTASNDFHTSSYALAIDSTNQCFIEAADAADLSQQFQFELRDDRWIGSNLGFTSPGGLALDAGDGTTFCAMRPLGATPLATQNWSFVEHPAASGSFWMRADADATLSLDATEANPAIVPVSPRMAPTDDEPRQRWRWTRVE